MEALLFIGVLAIGLGLVALFVYLEHLRSEELRVACTKRGWRYQAQDQSLVSRWELGPFDTGRSRTAHHVVSGEHQGRSFVAFEYSYKVSSGVGSSRSTTTYTYSVCALALPVALPLLVVEPEGWLLRIADSLGILSVIDVESAEFNRAFSVRAQDRKFASDVLHPRHLEVLLQDPRMGWWIEGASILTSEDEPLDLQAVSHRLEHLTSVVKQIPAFVWRDRGYDPETFGTDPTANPRGAL